jgi:trk system potassium uptake protein TrkH
VTGLVVQDTGSYWSVFGQSVILLLIQIGGLGVITVGAAFALLSGRKISLKQRSTMQEATAAPQMGGIVRLTGFILRITALFELVGAALLLPTFCADYGLRGIWYALFHSISAFCNAGFDLLGTEGAKFVSLTQYADNPLLTTVIAALIVFGGLGFLTWEDICTYRLDFHRYRMQSKVILVTTAFLLVLPSLYFYCFEFTAGSARQRILLSMFQSVTPRTAGFNTADLAAMGSPSQALMVVLMLLGGSPGSTAGGMKTTTFAVLLANMWATFRRREDAEFFGRRIDSSAVKNAATIAGMYLTLFFLGAFVIATAEQLPMAVCLYETASAVATVGLTLGITPQLGILSQGVLIALMFLGRVGGLTLIYAAFGNSPAHSRLPQEKIAIG